MAVTNLPAVRIHNLGFKYSGQEHLFLSDLNLEIAVGERFGLFGPNGAGKTTLMSLMTGLLRCDEGGVELMGRRVRASDKKVNRLFGFVPQEYALYTELTPVENLQFFGAWAGMSPRQIRKRSAELLGILGLREVSNKAVKHFSGGMKRRVNLAIGVIHDPGILFLDEPTVGVDVQSRLGIVEYLQSLCNNGTTLIYTSHQLSEAELLCERIAFIDEGKIVACGEMKALLATRGQHDLEGLFLSLTGKEFRN